MLLNEALGANLRRLCNGEASISGVCRAMKINRQQFDRYLAGTSMPNKATRTRICRHFKVEERDLFREPAGNGTGNGTAQVDNEAPWSHADLRAVLKLLHNEVQTSIAPGLYQCYFAHPHDPLSVMCSLMVVRRDGNLTTFRRLTGLNEPKKSWWSHFHGDHKGLILERRHVVYFVGLNATSEREPTQLAVRWVPDANPLLAGHASILTPSGPTVTSVVIAACAPGTSLRQAVKSSHAYSVEDASIDPIVLEALDQQCQALLHIANKLDPAARPFVSSKSQPEMRQQRS